MANCPTQSKFAENNVMNPDNQNLINLYKANKKLCANIVLGQGKSYGLALLSTTKSDDHPNGLTWELMSNAKMVNKPSGASTTIKVEVEIDSSKGKT
jgi:hypothetical protein